MMSNISNSKRSSFEARSPEDRADERCAPPSKIQRTEEGEQSLNFSRVVDSFTTIYGFAPNEFLPLEPAPAVREPRALDAIATALCDDALGHCLFSGFLNTFETARLSNVSKRFQGIASRQVERLDISRCKTLTAKDVGYIVRRFPNLKELDFDYCPQFGPAHLQALYPLRSSLHKLSLRGCSLEGADVSSFLSSGAGAPTHLQYLDLSAVDKDGSQRIGNETLEAIAKYCPDLTCLRVAWCKSITDSGLETLANASTGLEHLVELNLSLTGISDESIPSLKRIISRRQLRRLNISATGIECSALMNSLAQSTDALAIEELKLRFLADLTLSSLNRFLASPGSSNLRRLDLSWATPANDQTTPESVMSAIETALKQRVSKQTQDTTPTTKSSMP